MRSRMIAIAAGFMIAGWQPQLMSLPMYASIACCMLLLFWLKLKGNGYVLGCFLFGFLYSSLWSHWQLSYKLPDNYVRSDWQVVGTVQGLPRNELDATYFNLHVETIEPVGKPSDSEANLRTLKLAWYKPLVELKPEQRVRVEARLKPPHGQLNPSGFDYEKWLFVRGVDATGYVRELEVINSTSFSSINLLRDYINQSIEGRSHSPKEQALLKALITGYKNDLSAESWEILRVSGTVHLAVISGLHIGFMAVVGWWLGRAICFVVPRLTFYTPYLLSIICAFSYMLLAGAEIPTQRAFIMIFVFVLSAMMRWFIDHWTRWWLALICVLCFSPLAIHEVGFWLSFGAVALLLWFSQLPISWYSVFKLQLVLLVGMLPLYLFFFSGVSIVAPVINVFAIPLISALVVVAFINTFLNSVDIYFLNVVEEGMVAVFWWMVELAAGWSWSFVSIQKLDIISLLLLIVASVVVISPKGWISKPIVALLLLPIAINRVELRDSEQDFEVTVFDVGQGLSVLVDLGHYRLLYDTGASYKSGSSAFERSVLPYMKASGITSIDHLILSHNDNDHVGGYIDVEENLDVGLIYRSYGEENSYFKHCLQGEKWNVGGVEFEFLAGSVGLKDNDRSCVLLVSSDRCSLLLPGDIGKAVENRISKSKNFNITWLIAAHHGSKTSTSVQLLESFKPENVIFSAGFGNAFNHPHPDVVSRAITYEAKPYITFAEGAIFLNSSAQTGCITQTMRSEAIRLWR